MGLIKFRKAKNCALKVDVERRASNNPIPLMMIVHHPESADAQPQKVLHLMQTNFYCVDM